MAEMKALKCTVCGGTLRMREDGEVSKCESCGVEYTLPTMQKMVQALEGANLNVKGLVTEESLIGYAYNILEKNTQQAVLEAYSTFNEVLQINPENAKAWKGLFDCAVTAWPPNPLPDASERHSRLPEAVGAIVQEKEFNLDKAIQYSAGLEKNTLEALKRDIDEQYKEQQNFERQSQKWAEDGLCRYCGGELSFLDGKCKVCGKEQYTF